MSELEIDERQHGVVRVLAFRVVGHLDVFEHVLPVDLERQIGAFADHYNTHGNHESLGNLTPADVCHVRGATIRKMREVIKKRTIRQRRL